MVRDATTSSPKLDRPDIGQLHTSSKGNPPTDPAGGENRERDEELPESNENIPGTFMPETVLNPKKKQYNKLLSRGKKF